MKARKFVRIFLIAGISALLNLNLTAMPVSNSHVFHTSLTRIDYNAGERIFEISIQIFTHDLVPVLEKQTGKRVDLDKREVDSAILEYLNKNFILSDKKGIAKKLEWVGKEVDADTVWVYLETNTTENLDGYQLQNILFFESFPEQTNLVVCRYDGKKADLLFKAGDKIKNITADKPKEEE